MALVLSDRVADWDSQTTRRRGAVVLFAVYRAPLFALIAVLTDAKSKPTAFQHLASSLELVWLAPRSSCHLLTPLITALSRPLLLLREELTFKGSIQAY